MAKVLTIVNLVLKIVLILVLASTSILSLSMAYIMFAPDEFPKPFRLVYQYSESVPGYLPTGVLPAVASKDTDAHPTPVAEEVKPGEGLMVNMSTKIINLSDPSGRKYIRLTVVLEFVPEPAPEAKPADAHGEDTSASETTPQQAAINARMPLMDDIVITILSTKSFDSLYTADGKEALRQEILKGIDDRLPELKILSVYFTEFVVQ
jgi:flagellar basal body-associated protein FliL